LQGPTAGRLLYECSTWNHARHLRPDQVPLDPGLSSSSCGCSTSPYSLSYNSATVNPAPFFEFIVYPQAADGVPSLLQAELWVWSGSEHARLVTLSVASLTAGEPIEGAIQSPYEFDQTGMWRWTIEVVVTYAGGDLETYSMGEFSVVANMGPYMAPYGTGVTSFVAEAPHTLNWRGTPTGNGRDGKVVRSPRCTLSEPRAASRLAAHVECA
jgi:hypothetical protein